MRGNRLIKALKKWWWLVLLPLLFFIPKGLKKVQSMFGYSDNPEKYISIADLLYASMAGLGTDEKSMFSALKDLKGFELVKVYEAFGNKAYMLNGAFFGGYSLDLFGWFSKELNRKEKSQMKEIWLKSGLDLTF